MAEMPSYDDINAIIDQVYGPEDGAGVSSEASDSDVEPVEETETDIVEDDQPDGLVDDDDESSFDDDTDETPTDDEDDSEIDTESDDEEDDAPRGLMDELVTVKVNGEEMQVTVEQAVKGYQLASAANQKFEEAARVRQEAEAAVEFATNFTRLWTEEPTTVAAHLLKEAKNPTAIVEEVILRAAAAGVLPQGVADALEIDSDVVQRLSIKYEREDLEQERAVLEAQANRPNAADQPDEFGFTVQQYQEAFNQIIVTAGLGEGAPEAQREYLQKVLEFGDKAGIHNPYLAFAKFQANEVQLASARKERATKAVKKVSKESATAAALAPKGRVQHSPTSPEINSIADAAEAALLELEKKYGAIR